MPAIKDLQHKITVVTGVGTEVGRAPTLVFARKGVDLVIADLSKNRQSGGWCITLGTTKLTRQVDASNLC